MPSPLTYFLLGCLMFTIFIIAIMIIGYVFFPKKTNQIGNFLDDILQPLANFMKKIVYWCDYLNHLEKKVFSFWLYNIGEIILVLFAALLIGNFLPADFPFKKVWDYASYAVSAVIFISRTLWYHFRRKKN